MEEYVYVVRTDLIEPNRRLCFREEEVDFFSRPMQSGRPADPLRLSFDGERFRILDGEKRWRAAKRLKFLSVRAVIADLP